MANNSRSRKWLLTINNPCEHNLDHTSINEKMKMFNWSYYCLSDEEGGEENTYHTHLYFYCKNAVGFKKVKSVFESAHIDKACGSSKENRDYIRKEGKHFDKSSTSVEGSFEEYGELPLDNSEQCIKVSDDVYNMIKDGCSNSEIIDAHPSYMSKIASIDSTRNMLLYDKFRNEFRNVEVTYIFGSTGAGKTRYVMDKFGYKNVCKITSYKHPFDNYDAEDVILLDEFHSQIDLPDLLQITDGYPLKLDARYSDKVACYSKVFIISNKDLSEQYLEEQASNKESYNALIRRIKTIIKYDSKNGNTNITYLKPDVYKI